MKAMILKNDLKKVSDWLWEIPQSFRRDMKVPARIYISAKMLEMIFKDRSLGQLVNVATLPGIMKYSLAMPDIHEGYGFPIGGVAAMDLKTGVISPGGVGYDINCGVRLLRSNLNEKDVKSKLNQLTTEMQNQVPSGLGRGRKIKLSKEQIDKILEEGVPALVKKGYGVQEDVENCESEGRLNQANASVVSERAKNRGGNQVGTLGSGNHFLEIQRVDEVFDKRIADTFGLFKDQIVVMVHTGSRGLGHQIATDYIREMMRSMLKYGIKLPDRELAATPIDSSEGKRYFAAMACGANFAWANRHMISYYIRESWKKILGQKEELTLVYDVAHNVAKIEEHQINGERKKLMVHRKGATRAFPPGHPEVPERYREVGQPVLIPGSMGTASYVLAGTEASKEAWHTVNHGAGRRMSRKAATRQFPGAEVVKSLEVKGIIVKHWGYRGIAEEAPLAYKDVDSVVEVVDNAGLAKKVVKLVPLAVIKGE
jgi:tRNA-splicing ligase RtcB